jgi:hypothetical protein
MLQLVASFTIINYDRHIFIEQVLGQRKERFAYEKLWEKEKREKELDARKPYRKGKTQYG